MAKNENCPGYQRSHAGEPFDADILDLTIKLAMAKPYGKVNLKETIEKAGLTFPSEE